MCSGQLVVSHRNLSRPNASPLSGAKSLALAAGSVTVSVPIRDYGRIVRAVNNMAMLPQQADTHALLCE